MRTTQRKKIARRRPVVVAFPTGVNQRWSMDFVHDRLDDGRTFRILTVVDKFTKECVACTPIFARWVQRWRRLWIWPYASGASLCTSMLTTGPSSRAKLWTLGRISTRCNWLPSVQGG